VRIVVALDGSSDSLVGLEYVASLPLRPEDEVVLVSVVEREPVPARRLRRQHGRHLELLLEQAWAARRAAADRTVEQGQERLGDWQTPVSQVVRVGHPVEVLAGLTEELAADLLIVGPRGRGRVASVLLGSVTQSLLGLSRCPVLVARRRIASPHRIVLAADGSTHAATATAALAAFPLAADPIIHVVTVVAPRFSPYRDLEPEGSALLVAEEKALAAELAGAAAATLGAARLRTEISIRVGDAASEILEVARTLPADLVVVGSRGLGAIQGLLLGSVSRGVAASAPCSVLVVPEPSRSARSGSKNEPGVAAVEPDPSSR